MKKRLSHFPYNERSRPGWTPSTSLRKPLSPIRSTMKTVTYVPGTFVTLVPGPYRERREGARVRNLRKPGKFSTIVARRSRRVRILFYFKHRVLRVLRGEICFRFRYSSAALNLFDLSVLRCGAHRAHDVDVARAHAEIAAEADAYFFVTRIGIIAQQLEGRQDHPRRAKTALQRMVLLKCQLQGMERFVRADAFDGGGCGAVGLAGKEQARTHGPAVEHHRASAAYAMLAADMSSKQAEIVA